MVTTSEREGGRREREIELLREERKEEIHKECVYICIYICVHESRRERVKKVRRDETTVKVDCLEAHATINCK